MRLYSGTSEHFITDTNHNQIAEKLRNAYFDYYRHNPSDGEIRSWKNSLKSVSILFQTADLLDHGIILEYQLPLTSRRLDCLVCGKDSNSKDNAVILELKQWDKCEESYGQNEVVTWLGGAKREVLHPSVQTKQYRMFLEDAHTAFYEGKDPITLSACSYLHNYNSYQDDVIFAAKFKQTLAECPLFTADDFDPLCEYLTSRLKRGEGITVLNRVEQGTYRPSKKLMEHVSQVIKGTPQYILLDEQKVVYDKIYALAKRGFQDKQKHVLVVRGGPGTGKSVIAINIMADLLHEGYNTQYATGSKAFTETMRKAIGGRGAIQFKYFNSYMDAEANAIDVLICDEAHRIRESSNNRFTPKAKRSGKAQIDELLWVSKVAVFFIDDDQVVRPGEIGSSTHIIGSAERSRAVIHDHTLDIQFRCAGCESFVNWIENTLGMKKTANVLWNEDEDFDFKILSSPIAVENAIREKVAEGFTGRMTAGFCWEWSKKLARDGGLAKDVVIGDYARPWNAHHSLTRLPPNIPKAQLWAYDPNGIDQVGCVYTAQGFEFDYVGVIVGEDIAYDLDLQAWVGSTANSADPVVKKAGARFGQLTKNTYRVLFSRGMKGCYVYFMDKDTERFVKSRIQWRNA